jgi:hypothetical protein
MKPRPNFYCLYPNPYLYLSAENYEVLSKTNYKLLIPVSQQLLKKEEEKTQSQKYFIPTF